MLDKKYRLGTTVNSRIEAGDGHVKVSYRGIEAMNGKISRKGCYFKTCCSTRYYPSKGDAAVSFGKVTIPALQVADDAKLL